MAWDHPSASPDAPTSNVVARPEGFNEQVIAPC